MGHNCLLFRKTRGFILLTSMKKFTDLSLSKYLDELSSEAPVPGGGSAAAYIASLAMGLTQMVGRVSLKRKRKAGLSPSDEAKEDSRRASIQRIIDSVEKAKRDAFKIVDLDPAAYEKVIGHSGQPEKIETALQESFQIQADLGFLIVMAKKWNVEMKALVSGSIKNDLFVAESFLKAAFDAAYHTARINVVYYKDETAKQKSEKILSDMKSAFDKEAAHAGA